MSAAVADAAKPTLTRVDSQMQIGEVAGRTGRSINTIRHYDHADEQANRPVHLS